MSRPHDRTPTWRRRLGIFLLAMLVYLPASSWGIPYATSRERADPWGVDDAAPLGALAQLHDVLTPGAPEERNLGYPLMHSFLLVAAFAPYLAYLKVTGDFGTPAADYPFGFAHPIDAIRILAFIARLLSVMLAAGIVVAAYEIGVLLWGRAEGPWTAAFVLLTYPMMYYSRTANVDVPVLFFTALALVAFVRCLVLGLTRRRIIALGVLAGLALATKEPSVASFIAIPLVLLVVGRRAAPPHSWGELLRWGAIGAASTIAAYAIGSGAIVDPERWWAHIRFAQERVGDIVTGDTAFMTHFPATLEGNVRLLGRITRHLADALSLPGLVLGVAGIAVALRRSPRSLWFAVPIVTYLLVLFVSARNSQLRYIMPAAFGLAVFGGYAAAQARAASHRLVRMAGVATAAFALAVLGLRAADLTHAMLNDSRYEAGRWFTSVTRAGDRIEYFGSTQKNPHLPAEVELVRAIEYHGAAQPADRSPQAAARIRTTWAERQSRFVVLMPDHSSLPDEPFPATCPPEIFHDLEEGRLGYVPVKHFETSALLPWVRRPPLDYPVVNPPIRIYALSGDALARTAGRSP